MLCDARGHASVSVRENILKRDQSAGSKVSDRQSTAGQGHYRGHSPLPPSLPFFPWPLAKLSKTTVRVCLSSQDTDRQEASWTRKRQVRSHFLEEQDIRMELELYQDSKNPTGMQGRPEKQDDSYARHSEPTRGKQYVPLLWNFSWKC